MFVDFLEKGKNTDYIEIQICMADVNTSPYELVNIKNIHFGLSSSIYIDFKNYEQFFQKYNIYFNNALHANLEENELDPYGINYFSVDKTIHIIDKIKNDKPLEYDKIINFLNKAKDNNGFYILGI